MTTSLTLASKNTKQLIVIDSNIDDWQALVSNIGTDATILILNPLQNGLTQIADTITAYSNLDAIHLFSHGSVASLQLGSSTLNSKNLAQYTQQLTTIGNALSENGDLLLYGCNVAQGAIGSVFINQFAALTGADVAASDDLTGANALGGDWILEKTVGIIDTPTLQSSYGEVLALPTAFQLFNTLLTPEEKTVVGGEQAGMIRTMADFAKAAYHLEASENKVINDFSPNADAAVIGLTTQVWTALNLHPTLSATSILTGYKQINSTTTTPFPITITNGMFDDGFYINGNAAACVERCGDAIVLSFRGTNDNDKDGVNNPDDLSNTNHPDKDQWSNIASHYALFQPLITAFDAYVAANGISKIYVTGHSMGGAVVLEYMSRHLGSQYQAVTFGAPPFTKLSSFWGVTERKDYAQDLLPYTFYPISKACLTAKIRRKSGSGIPCRNT